MSGAATATAASDNPYIGPRPFRKGEALRGRDREARGVVDKLLGERILLLHSPSGAGKTSIIQASLAPYLEKAGFQLCARAAPFSALRMNLPEPVAFPVRNRYVYSAVFGLLGDSVTDPAELAELTLGQALDRHRERGDQAYQAVLFDQLEEVLVLNPADREAQAEFFRQVGAALDDPSRWALFSIREDYMGGLDRYTCLLPTGLRARYRLDFLERRAALQAIRGPARAHGVDIEEEAATLLFDDLRTISVQSPGQEEPEPVKSPYVEPVQLQVVCHRLWRRLRSDGDSPSSTVITAEQITPYLDVAGALGAYYADAVAETVRKTGADERVLRDWFETHLITAQRFRAQTRTGPAVDSGVNTLDVLVRLQRRYLIRSDPRPGASWYELSHDRLVDPVLEDNARWRDEHLASWQRRAASWVASNRKAKYLLGDAELRTAHAELGKRHRDRIPAEVAEREFVEESARALADRSFREGVNIRHAKLVAVIVVEAAIIAVLLVLLLIR